MPSAPAPAHRRPHPPQPGPSLPRRPGPGVSKGRSGPAAGPPRRYYSGSTPPAWPDALNQPEPETVILPKLVVSRPPAHGNGARNGARTSARTATTGQRRPADVKAVRPDALAEPETMLLPVVPDLPGKASRDRSAPVDRRGTPRPRRGARSRGPLAAGTAAPGTVPPRATRKGPVKFIASLSRRLTRAIGRHRPLIVALAAIAAIAAAATLISVRLDASPRPARGAADGHSRRRAATARSFRLPPQAAWPTTAPAAVPASCKQVSLKGMAGASVVSYLDDNTNQHDLVATEAKGLRAARLLLDEPVQPDRLGPGPIRSTRRLMTELTTADQSGPCGLRFATLSDNDPSHEPQCRRAHDDPDPHQLQRP